MFNPLFRVLLARIFTASLSALTVLFPLSFSFSLRQAAYLAIKLRCLPKFFLSLFRCRSDSHRNALFNEDKHSLKVLRAISTYRIQRRPDYNIANTRARIKPLIYLYIRDSSETGDTEIQREHKSEQHMFRRELQTLRDWREEEEAR